jgi:glycosyltransferase involved in cell wall biosynthesis
MRGFYSEYDRIAASSAHEAEGLERAAIKRADLAVYASDWAAASAKERYGADARKVQVVPFGANLEGEIPQAEVDAAIDARLNEKCRLLFVGIDWLRKGADVAVAIVQLLNDTGVPAELGIVGSSFPIPSEAERYVKFHGFIDKRSRDGRRRLDVLFANAHFLVHPARAECYGVALCEANAFGVPCLASSVGGIPTIVRDGRNGYLFPRDAPPGAYVGRIKQLMSERAEYTRLAQTAAAEYRG